MSDRHPLRPDLIDVDAYRRDHGLDARNEPVSLSPEEHEAADHPGEVAPMADQTAVSPTGIPVVPATGIFLKIAAVIVALASTALVYDYFPSTHIDETIAQAIVSLGAFIGIVSPGVRKSA